MYNKGFSLYKEVIRYYFNKRASLRETARRFGIHYQTLYRWVARLKGNSKSNLTEKSCDDNRRFVSKQERMVVAIKESKPGITVSEAQHSLQQKGYRISKNGIWKIWQRYGYAGFDWQRMSNDFTFFCRWSAEAKRKFLQAKALFECGLIRESAAVLNTIPFLPRNDLLLKIPDEYLNLQRRLEKLSMQFGTLSLKEYIHQLEIIYREFIRKRHYYSAMRTGLPLIIALSWKGEYRKMKRLITWLEQLVKKETNRVSKNLFPYKFMLVLMKGRGFLEELKIREALKCARVCYKMLLHHKFMPARLLANLGIFCIALEDYNRAEHLLLQSLRGVDMEFKKKLIAELALLKFIKGETREGLALLRKSEIYHWAKDARLLRYRAFNHIIEGEMSRALRCAQESLQFAKGGELNQDIAHCYLLMATAYAGFGDIKKAKELLTTLISFARKTRLKRLELLARILSGRDFQPTELLSLPTIKLAFLLRHKGYHIAYDYAQKKGIKFYLYRSLFFFPEIISKRLDNGDFTGCPRGILRLSLFNRSTVWYRINFLGKPSVYRNQKYLKSTLIPKDIGVLIYLAHKSPEPGKNLNLTHLYQNFWTNSESASRNFSHLLVRLKKALKIPTHLLEMSRGGGTSVLINQGIYFTTDYQEFEQTLARAKALQRAGEWGFARKEFLRAFRLFRGEPFKKNFDNWSADMRFRILTQFETEAINFAKSCLEHNNKTDARKILQKVLKIIPDSEEAKRLSDSLVV